MRSALVDAAGAAEVTFVNRSPVGDALDRSRATVAVFEDGSEAPTFDLSALALCPCPTVVVTEDRSERAVVRLLAAGASEVVARTPGEGDFARSLKRAIHRADARGVRDRGATPELLSAAVEKSDLMVLLTDADGTIEYVNPAWSERTGYLAEEAVGRNPRILKSGKMASKDYEILWDRISSGRIWQGRLVNKAADGSEYVEQVVIGPVFVEGEVRSYMQVGLDVTESVGASDVLERNKRFQLLGRTIGAMAHDLNNIFAVTLANTEMAAREMEHSMPDAAGLGALRDVLAEIENGRALVRHLLMYFGRWRIQPRPVDAMDEVHRVARELAPDLPDGLSLEVRESDDTSPTVSVDLEGFEEVVSHLVELAWERMPDEGTVELQVGTQVLDADFQMRYPWGTTGVFARISVVDDGLPMDEADRSGLFDFDSEERLRGGISGLGWVVTYGFVKQHGGFVVVETVPEGGTRVDLLLPLSSVSPAESRESVAVEADEVPRRKLGVLYAEDNPRLRRIGLRVLEGAGYRTFEAEDGADALRVLAEHPHQIDLVLSDLVMPGVDGVELLRRTRELDDPPGFLFTTGHADAEGGLPSGSAYILKPWNASQLLEAVERMLESAESGPAAQR